MTLPAELRLQGTGMFSGSYKRPESNRGQM